MKRIEITINGEAYPCSPTMGAMLRFKEQTGREVTQTDGCFSDLCIYLWCCIRGASHREGKEFNLSLMDFADAITSDDISAWNAELQELLGKGDKGDDSEKKSR